MHVADEALTGFLPVWNSLVLRVREIVPWSPLPAFSFPVWLTGLALAILALAFLTKFALRGARWLRPFAYFYGILMVLNGLGHFALTVYLDRLAPGVYTAPLLLAASAWLLAGLSRSRRGD